MKDVPRRVLRRRRGGVRSQLRKGALRTPQTSQMPQRNRVLAFLAPLGLAPRIRSSAIRTRQRSLLVGCLWDTLDQRHFGVPGTPPCQGTGRAAGVHVAGGSDFPRSPSVLSDHQPGRLVELTRSQCHRIELLGMGGGGLHVTRETPSWRSTVGTSSHHLLPEDYTHCRRC